MRPYINDYFREIGLSNYLIFLCIAVLAALICYRILGNITKMSADTFNFYLLAGILSIVFGFFSANLFQSVYNYAQTGTFEMVGMTVMGGVFGAAFFFVVYSLILGSTRLGEKHLPYFWHAVNIIIPCIVIAQSIGRIGCFLAGCCYGRETTSPLGVSFVDFYKGDKAIMHPNPRLPTQLFEAIFLLILFAVMLTIMLAAKKQRLSALIYLYCYSIFRFVIEFFRDDERGASILGMTPSQLMSIIFFLIAVAITFVVYVLKITPFAGKATRTKNPPSK